MQAASNGVVQNGAVAGAPENGHDERDGAPEVVTLSQTSQDIVRLIGQYLRSEGLK